VRHPNTTHHSSNSRCQWGRFSARDQRDALTLVRDEAPGPRREAHPGHEVRDAGVEPVGPGRTAAAGTAGPSANWPMTMVTADSGGSMAFPPAAVIGPTPG